MRDYRLQVFYTVAQRLSFSRAADELDVSQPAVSRHIRELEKEYKVRLFDRSASSIRLTAAGKVLLRYAGEIFSRYRQLDAEMAALQNQQGGVLKIGASSTAGQYIIPEFLAAFRKDHPSVQAELSTGNTQKIEQLLHDNSVDIGIVEGNTRRAELEYQPFLRDEIVLCTRTSNPVNPTVTLSEVRRFPMVWREAGSGSLEVIHKGLSSHHLKSSDFQTEIVLENTESIKNYLLYSDAFAFLSVAAMVKELKNNTLKIVDVEDLVIERYFYLVRKKADRNPLADLFFNYLPHNL